MRRTIQRAAGVVALMLFVLCAPVSGAGAEPVLVRAFEQFDNARSPQHGMTRGCGTLLFKVWVTPPPGGSPPQGGETELWKSDGTAGDTAPVFDATGVPRICLRGSLYYLARDALMRTQEVPASETTVHEWEHDWFPTGIFKAGDLLYVQAGDNVHGRELWKSDGAAAGTRLLKDISRGERWGDPLGLAAAGDRFYFSATDGKDRHGRELWVTDGTRRGTRLVEDIREGPGSAFFGFPNDGSVALMGGTLFFGADDHDTGLELWKTDGTARGTRLVKDLRPGPQGSTPEKMVRVGDLVYFTADDGKSGRELWRTDGTSGGTRRVKDIRPGIQGSAPRDLMALRGRLVFTAVDGASGRELWSSGGTAATTRRIRDIRPGTMGSGPKELERVGGGAGAVAYFSADDGRSGRELWGTNGTVARRVGDIRPGPRGSSPIALTRMGHRLYFGATDGTAEGSGLWRYDKPSGGL